MKKTFTVLLLCTAVLFTACAGNGGGDDDPDDVPISFGIASSALETTSAGTLDSRQATQPSPVTIVGTNGTLRLTRIAMVVEKFELEPVEVEECDVKPKPALCHDFEQRYFTAGWSDRLRLLRR